MGPVSTPGSIFIMVMPVSGSPANSAAWMGAAPRHRGRSEPWTLIHPWGGKSRMAGRRICPKAATTITSGAHARSCWMASGWRKRSGWMTGIPRATAASFTAGDLNVPPRPTGRSGWVTAPTTGYFAARAVRTGTAKSGEPIKTKRKVLVTV